MAVQSIINYLFFFGQSVLSPTEYDHLILTELYGSYGTGPNKVLIRNFNDDPVLLGDRQSIVAAIHVSSEVRLLPAVKDADHQERRCLALRLLPRHQVHSSMVHDNCSRIDKTLER